MTFKSARAAKSAYTRAKNLWDAKRTEGFVARDTCRETFRTEGSMPTEQYEALVATEKRCEAEAATMLEGMRAIYVAATAQGFYIHSYEFGENATRDLIAANMD